MDVYFYHLETRSLEDALPELLERALARGWRSLVRLGSPERARAIDAHLWTYRDDSFLPHGLANEAQAAAHPVLISLDGQNLNSAQVCFLADGALPSDWSALAQDSYQRAALIFEGRDPEAVEIARVQWRAVKTAGLLAQYWQQSPVGKWEKKA